MSVAYEPRAFLNDSAYSDLDGGRDDQHFTDNDMDHLSHYTTEPGMLSEERDVMGGGVDLMNDHIQVRDEHLAMGDEQMPVTEEHIIIEERHSPTIVELPADFSSPLQTTAPAPDDIVDTAEPTPEAEEDSSVEPRGRRVSNKIKPARDVRKGDDGKYHCPRKDCEDDVRAFSRKCEWNKHMDKHERPYRCKAAGCEALPGFTYSGGLLRHEREVHGKHGGPRQTFNCPHLNCKRHTGKGFSRQENLNEHLRRVHTDGTGQATPPAEIPTPPAADVDNESEKSGSKRKRRSSDISAGDEMAGLRHENKRLCDRVAELEAKMEQRDRDLEDKDRELEQRNSDSLSLMAQIAELQQALRSGMSHPSLSAPTAQML